MLKSRYLNRDHLIILLLLLPGFILRLIPARNLQGAILGLDPYLFFRWANYLKTHGYIPEIDYYKYFPLGLNVRTEMWILSLSIYLLGEMLGDLYLATILLPPLSFLTGSFILACAIMRKFGKKTAFIFALFISFIPSFLFRLSAGFSDKENLFYIFSSASIYFMIRYFEDERFEWAFYSGLFLGLTMLSWGGYKLILIPLLLTEILFLKDEKVKKFALITIPIIWYFGMGLTERYGGTKYFIASPDGALSALIFGIILIEKLVKKMKFKLKFKIGSLEFNEVDIILGVFLIIGVIIAGGMIKSILNIYVFQKYNRFFYTVAENQKPYLINWIQSLSYFFVLVLVGLPLLVYRISKDIKISILVWISFLFLVLSRFSPQTEDINKIFSTVYWIPLFLSILGLYFIKKEDFTETFFLIYFLLVAIMARSAIRIFFALSIPFAIIISLTVKEFLERLEKEKLNTIKYVSIAIIIILLLPVVHSDFMQQLGTYPTISIYWIKAMEDMKNITSKYDVISHWWDYGYWVQYYMDRFTSVDGGNKYYVRNFYNARYFFIGKNKTDALKALEVLGYPDYILITSREPLVYSAISTIAYEDTFLGIYTRKQLQGNYTVFFGGASQLKHEINADGVIIPPNISYVVGVSVEKDKVYGLVFNPLLEKNFMPLKVKYYCINSNCFKQNGTLDGCVLIKLDPIIINGNLTYYPSYSIYIPQEILNTTFIQVYLLKNDLNWIKEVYNNEVMISSGNIIYYCKDLCGISLLNERIPDLRLYKIDYRKLVKDTSR